ncbi:unnamed protein product [Soboliphyme baturini]|uniref:Uncharacterized protein n=1 Tax=Soboliphyme baturini TaxID=241478 RepID=A0A3P7Z0M6_9BILA|nr:unnamed protein product [Soboliphyme baturini]
MRLICRFRLKEAEIVGVFIERLSVELLKSLKSACDKVVSSAEDMSTSPQFRRSSDSEASKDKPKICRSTRPKSIVGTSVFA